MKKGNLPLARARGGGPMRSPRAARAIPLAFSGPPATTPAHTSSPRPASVVSGRLLGHRDGYGFVVPDTPLEGTDLDIYIPADAMASAMHGDQVKVQVVRLKAGGRLEGRIIAVTRRAQQTVVGQFHCGARYNYVLPFDHRLPFEIVIPLGEECPEGRDARRPRTRHRQFGGEVGADSGARAGLAAARAREAAAGGRAGFEERLATPRSLEGLIVDVELTRFPHAGALPHGRIIDVLGRRDEFGVDVEMVIRKFHLPHRFPADVLEEASAAPQYISESDREGRRDFRGLPIVTIDGETAKDFDDAVLVERLSGGNYLLHVHIADVAHYVPPGSALDREARLRGTSVYFPDRAVPMLPLELSNGICSLNPHSDRLVMSALVEIDPEGRVAGYKLSPGIIRSAERMTYTAVRDILADDPTACQRYAALVPNFKTMQELSLILNRRRQARGSIDFDLPEPLIEFDAAGQMTGIARSERNIAHRIIEEFMLAANEVVAQYLEGRGIPSLYRIHEKPDPKKVVEFEEIAATFGYSLGVEPAGAQRLRAGRRSERERHPRFYERRVAGDLEITPRHYQRLTQRLEGKPEERILSYLMLRSLKQARYSEENTGHFALATPAYTHFTSPIRRYPDLVVHRTLKAALASAPRDARSGSPRSPSPHTFAGGAWVSREELHALGLETSEAERRAADAERELLEWKKASFMAQHVGDEFGALIISLSKYGFFVELADLFVEGFVPLATLVDDFYVYRQRQRAIVGEHTGRVFRLGAQVRVRLDRIDPSGNKLEFSVTGVFRAGRAHDRGDAPSYA